jgi:hypothetical protein
MIPEGRAEKEGKEYSTSAPTLSETEHPYWTGAKKGLAGAYADTLETARGLTSPIGVATMGLGGLAEGAGGAVGKIAKIGSRVAGLGFGAQGIKQAVEGGEDIAAHGANPENIKSTLQGAGFGVLGGAGGLHGTEAGEAPAQKTLAAPIRAAAKLAKPASQVIPSVAGMSAASATGLPHAWLIGGALGRLVLPPELLENFFAKGRTLGLNEDEANIVTLRDRYDEALKKAKGPEQEHKAHEAGRQQGIPAPDDVLKAHDKAQTYLKSAKDHLLAAQQAYADKVQSKAAEVPEHEPTAADVEAARPDQPTPTKEENDAKLSGLMDQIAPEEKPAPVPENVKGPGQVQPETFPQEPTEAPQAFTGMRQLPGGEPVGRQLALPAYHEAEGVPEQPRAAEPVPEAPKPATAAEMAGLKAVGGKVAEAPEKAVAPLVKQGLAEGSKDKPRAVAPVSSAEKALGRIPEAAPVAEAPKPVVKAEAPKEAPEGRTPEQLTKVTDVIKDHSDQDLARLGKKYGVDDKDYDFSARDEKRHRVERDRFVKDVLAKMPDKDVDNISRLSDEWQNKNSELWTEAERTPASKAQRSRAIMQEHEGGPKDVAGGAPEAPKQVAKNASGESDASLEAINRAVSQKAQGIKTYRVNQSGNRIPVLPADAADAHANRGEHIIEVDKDGSETIKDSGAGAGPLRAEPAVAQGRAVNDPNHTRGHNDQTTRMRAEKAAEAPADAGKVTLHHYSTTEGITETDPEKMGTGKPGAEQVRAKDPGFLPRTHLGDETYKEKGVTTLPNHYTTEVDRSKYYDIAKDPEGIWQEALRKGNATDAENAVHDAGYHGYFHDGGYISFEKLPVKPFEGKVGTEEGAKQDTDHFAQAKKELPNGTLSEKTSVETSSGSRNDPNHTHAYNRAKEARAEEARTSKVGTEAGAKQDTDHFAQAKKELPNGTLSEQLGRAQELKDKSAEKGKPAQDAHGFYPATHEEHVAAIKENSQAANYHMPENMKDNRVFTDGKGTFYGISPDGEVQRFVNNSGNPSSLLKAARSAIDNGGKTIDAWDLNVPKVYEKLGFKRTEAVPYDAEHYGEPSDALKDAWKKQGWKEGQEYPAVQKMAADEDSIIARKHNDEGGSSFSKKGDLLGRDGYSVGINKELEHTVDTEKVTAEDVAAYRARPEVQAALKANPEAFIGTWVDGGKTYFDTSVHVPDLDAAKKLGADNTQKAIFDLKNKKSIDLPQERNLPAGYPKTDEEAAAKITKEGGVGGGAPSAAAAPARELPELAEKHLTPEEKAGVLKSPAQTEKFVQRMSDIPEVHEYADIALAGEGARKWYQRSAKAFDAMAEEAPEYFKENGDKDKFINLLAASSPRQPVAMNLRESLRTWKAYVDAGRPEGDALKSLLDENLTPAVSKTPNALKALNGEEMWPDITKNKNFKVPSFARNLRGWLGSVTSDGWMSLFAGLDPREISSAHSYHPLSVATRAAAEELGWEPAEAQAAIWSFTQALQERGEELPEEVRKHSEDFVDLMAHDPQVRDLLADLGVTHANLDAKLAAIGEKPEVSSRTSSTTSRSVERLKERIETARGKGSIPPPKSAQGALDFREAPAHESRVRDADVEFNPEQFKTQTGEDTKLRPLGKKKSPLGKAKR